MLIFQERDMIFYFWSCAPFSVVSRGELLICKTLARFVPVVSTKIMKVVRSFAGLGFPSRHDPLCVSLSNYRRQTVCEQHEVFHSHTDFTCVDTRV